MGDTKELQGQYAEAGIDKPPLDASSLENPMGANYELMTLSNTASAW